MALGVCIPMITLRHHLRRCLTGPALGKPSAPTTGVWWGTLGQLEAAPRSHLSSSPGAAGVPCLDGVMVTRGSIRLGQCVPGALAGVALRAESLRSPTSDRSTGA